MSDRDMQDQSKSYNQYQEQDMRNLSEQEQIYKKNEYVVPNDRVKLRACVHCRLIKSDSQWKESKRCQNCGDVTNYLSQTTDKFTGVIAILSDGQSWVRRKKKLAKTRLSFGAYAVKVDH